MNSNKLVALVARIGRVYIESAFTAEVPQVLVLTDDGKLLLVPGTDRQTLNEFEDTNKLCVCDKSNIRYDRNAQVYFLSGAVSKTILKKISAIALRSGEDRLTEAQIFGTVFGNKFPEGKKYDCAEADLTTAYEGRL